MSISSIIGGGVAVVRTRPRLVAFWVVVNAVIYTGSMLGIRPYSQAVLAAQATDPGNPVGIAPHGAFIGLIFVAALVLMLFYVAAFASIVRAVEQPLGDRLSYIRFGGDELRLIGLGLIFIIAAIVAELVLILVFGLVVGLLVALVGRTSMAVASPLLGLVFLAAFIFVEVRLSLAGALTVLRHRIVIGEAWRVTRGRFWTLFGAYLLMGLAFVVVSLVLIGITNASLLSAYAHLDLASIRAASVAQSQTGLPVVILQLAVSAVVNGIALSIFSGAVATAAIELGSPAADVADVFS